MSNEMYMIGGASTINSNSGPTSSAACSSSRWLTEEVFKLIDIVQRDEAIYNPRHKYYFCRPYVENFWREVDLKLEKNPGASLAKWTNLRISFRREYTNYIEEKVPPCWSYFDRMFFLHPYLRKKHQQPKSLDSQVQDALVQISSLSNRLQRERMAAAASSISGLNVHSNDSQQSNRGDSINSQSFGENYLDYFEDDGPNHPELDEIIDDDRGEQRKECFQRLDTRTLSSDVKSECEETNDEYDEQRLVRNRTTPLQDDDAEIEDERDIQNFSADEMTARLIAKRKQTTDNQQQLQRFQTLRTEFVDDLRPVVDNKRIRTEESMENGACLDSVSPIGIMQRSVNSSTPAHTNVSFVRPTFAKPIDMVSTTSGIQSAVGAESTAEPEASTSAGTISSSLVHLRHHPQYPYQHRSSEHNVSINDRNDRNSYYDLCDCKTDPDAMFLMSLLPDIQKLNGRDRGKIKIAFQNILQDFLYPD